nr:MAG: capsid protein [Wenzhou shrew picorna-like virus 5]
MSQKQKIETISESATDPTSVQEQAVRDTVEKDVTSAGLESQETPVSQDVELEQTSLDMAEPVTEEYSALTEYQDVSASVVSGSTATAVDILDKNFMFPQGYFKVIERSMPLGTYVMNNNAPNQYPIARLDIVNRLLKYRQISEKLIYAHFVRFNLEVQIKCMATNYHYGQLMLVWRPAYSPYQIAKYENRQTNGPNGGQSELYVTFYPDMNLNSTTTMCTGPYDNVFTASQLDHHVLPITAGANITLKLPWTLNKQYVETKNMMMPNNHIGFLDIYQLTPIAPSDIDPPVLQFFGRFRDIVGFGYRAPGDPCVEDGDKIIRRRYLWNGASNWDDRLNAIYPQGGQWLKPHSTIAQPNLGLGTTSWTVDARTWPWWQVNPTPPPNVVASEPKDEVPEEPKKEEVVENEEETTEVAESGELARQTKGGALYSTFNAAVSTANTVATWVGDALAYMGLSKPPMKGTTQRFSHIAPPVSNAVGPDYCVSNGVNPESLVKNEKSDHSEMVLIENLGKCETYLGWWNFNSNNTINANLSPTYHRICPNSFKQYGIHYRTPASMVLEKFALWRSNCRYRLQFSSSSFVVCRVAITVAYTNQNNLNEKIGIVPTQIVEIKGDTSIEGEIPYLHPAPWMTWQNFLATIQIRLLDQKVSWKNASNPPVYASIWVSWPGLQVAFPTDVIESGIPWVAMPVNDRWAMPQDVTWPAFRGTIRERTAIDQSPDTLNECDDPEKRCEVAESGKLPGVSPSCPPKQYGMNDIVTSVYHMAKRFNPVYGRVLMPFNAGVMKLVRRDDNVSGKAIMMITTYQPSNSWMAPCFRWVRGSYNLISVGSHQMVDGLATVVEYDAPNTERPWFLMNKGPAAGYGKSIYMRSVTGNHMSRNGQGLIASRSPFHANYPFVSSPVLYLTIDPKDNGLKYSTIQRALRERVPFTMSDGLAQRNTQMPYNELAYGDDLCYNQWMGCPLAITFKDVENGYFPTNPMLSLLPENSSEP